MRILNYFKNKINSFKDNEQVVKEFEKTKKGKQQIEARNNELLERNITQDNELLGLYREMKSSGDWHDKFNLQKKINSEMLELILKEISEVRTAIQKTISSKDREIRKLSKENEELLRKQLGE